MIYLNNDIAENARIQVKSGLQRIENLASILFNKEFSNFTDMDIKCVIEGSSKDIEEKLSKLYEAVKIPKEIIDIQNYWTKLQLKHGNEGSCVVGAGFTFKYKSVDYKMPPIGPFQGSISWEASKDEIQKKLEEIGCTNINYIEGEMD